MQLRFSFILAGAILSAGCTYDVFKTGKLLHDDKTENNSVLSMSATVDWNLMQTMVLDSCTHCHAGDHAPNLSTFALMQSNITLVYAKVSAGIMPPANDGYAPLSPCKVATVKKWMDLGTPLTSTVTVGSLPECSQPAVTEPPTSIKDQPLNYQVLLTQILQVHCLKCHDPADPSDASLTLFSPYSEIQNDTKTWQAPGATSLVVQALSRSNTDPKRMPPLKEGAPLTPDEIDYISRWIDAGKPQ